MPLPLLFIGVAAATGGLGAGKAIKAGVDARHAKRINRSANDIVEASTAQLNAQRFACGKVLRQLGDVDFRDSEGLDELGKLHIDEQDFVELKSMVTFAGSLAGGALAGTAGGALVAFSAYGAAQALAVASTGTAIASLSGAAATNATLAFFGGGSLAAGGLGMAGGTMVLGGLVAGPALLGMGFVAGHAAKKEVEKARTNKAEAQQVAAQLDTASLQCETIRRRTCVLYNLLARLDACFLPLVYRMEDILAVEGDDYSQYTSDSKRVIASCASVAVSIKTVLDTPLLTDDGLLTDASEATASSIEEFLKRMRISI